MGTGLTLRMWKLRLLKHLHWLKWWGTKVYWITEDEKRKEDHISWLDWTVLSTWTVATMRSGALWWKGCGRSNLFSQKTILSMLYIIDKIQICILKQYYWLKYYTLQKNPFLKRTNQRVTILILLCLHSGHLKKKNIHQTLL